MDKFYHSVRLDPAFCKRCINCIKRCPTQAIHVRNGKAQVSGKSCIDCRGCIRVCPYCAKYATYDELNVVKQHEYMVALPAPSLYGQLNDLGDVNVILNGLLLMGFDDASEVGAATEVVSGATGSYLTEHGDQLSVINTACPPVIRLVRVRSPGLMPHLLSLNPPVEVAACMAVERTVKETRLVREKTSIIFVFSCPSKVTYVKSSLGMEKSEVDHVLVIEEVYLQLLLYIKVAGEDGPEIDTPGKIGVSWGWSGGKANDLFAENYLTADGVENVTRVLEDLKDQKLSSLKFVELNACSDGCVGGVPTVEGPCTAEAKLKRLRKHMPAVGSHMEAGVVDCVPWATGVQSESVFRLGDNMVESFSKLERVGRLCKKFPGLDCGPYGVPTCRALAEDIVRGKASEKDYVYFLWDSLHSPSREVAILADDLVDGDKGGAETLNILKEHIQRTSNEMAVLDSKVREK